MNEIVLSGNVGNNPKTSMAGNHTKSTFSLAVRDGKDKEGEAKTLWFFCETWNATAEFVNQYLKKGNRIEVIGKAVPGRYEQNGVVQSTFHVVCRSVKFAGSKRLEEVDEIEEELFTSDTIFCPNCHREVSAEENCPNCGCPLSR